MTEKKDTSWERKVRTLEMDPWEAGAIKIGRNTWWGGGEEGKERKRMGTEEVKKIGLYLSKWKEVWDTIAPAIVFIVLGQS